ncbi:DNA repair protein RAD51-like protein 3 [Iris pallida]|uniref:DNA repair protein RAD51 homolog 3 n=1 Tax=Iris pallida TaxID=29817 RepID=A0AAX6HQ36_IRIPA|nr:DNA repair protein RAD51-like protein 3 [Iris pallida]
MEFIFPNASLDRKVYSEDKSQLDEIMESSTSYDEKGNLYLGEFDHATPMRVDPPVEATSGLLVPTVVTKHVVELQSDGFPLDVVSDKAGYTSVNQSPSTSASDLAQDEDHLECPASDNCAQTAWDMLSEEHSLKHITTGCEDLDAILGGGIHCKEVTEIGGVPGIGKTQLGIQLAINVQIPVNYGGLGGKAIYIDTEGSFMVERAYQIAEACVTDTLENFSHPRKDFENCQEKLHPNNFLANIFYFCICSYTEQIVVINYMEKFLGEHKDKHLY